MLKLKYVFLLLIICQFQLFSSSDKRVLILRFEELIGNEQFYTFKKLFSHCDIAIPDGTLRLLLKDCSFEVLSGGRKPGEEDMNCHYRKGISGDWKNYFTKDIKEKFNIVTGNSFALNSYK